MKINLAILAVALCCGACLADPVRNGMAQTFSISGAMAKLTNNATDDCTCQHALGVNGNDGYFNGFVANVVSGGNGNYFRPLYDVNGTIAGCVVSTPKTQVNTLSSPQFNYDAVPMFRLELLGGIQVLSIIVYFVDPSIICTTGRTGTTDGDNFDTAVTLIFQNGATPAARIIAPMLESAALQVPNNPWSDNNCFPGMGNHTFYKVNSWGTNNCRDINPPFLLFANNQLVGFGLAWTGKSQSNATVMEHPPKAVIKTIVGDSAPQCVLDLADQGQLTTIHVFFTKTRTTCSLTIDQVKSAFQRLKEQVTQTLECLVCYITGWFCDGCDCDD